MVYTNGRSKINQPKKLKNSRNLGSEKLISQKKLKL